MPAKYPLHSKAVAIATAELGVREEPDGSNSGPRVRVYQGVTWLGGTNWPWCVAFWLWSVGKAGLAVPYRGAGAYAFLDWARKVGWATTVDKALPGDAVVWNVGAGHMSMYLSRKGNVVRTIDGNVSNRVDYRNRHRSLVRGIVHVPEKPVVLPPPRPPVFEVVTGENGKVVYISGARAIGKRLARFLKKYPGGVVIRRKKVK